MYKRQEPSEHYEATDTLSREIRAYSAHLFHAGLSREQLDLVASMIEEVDFTAALTETLHQIARRVTREAFSTEGRAFADEAIDRLDPALNTILLPDGSLPRMPAGHSRQADFEDIRWRIIESVAVPMGEKGALLALLGSMERAESLIDRIAEERASVDRGMIAAAPVPRRPAEDRPGRGMDSDAGLMPAE